MTKKINISCSNSNEFEDKDIPRCDCNEDDEDGLLPHCKNEDEAVPRCGSTEFEDGNKVCLHSNVIEDADVRQFASTEAEDTCDLWCVVKTSLVVKK